MTANVISQAMFAVEPFVTLSHTNGDEKGDDGDAEADGDNDAEMMLLVY